MENLVIFTSPVFFILLLAVILLHTSCAVVRKLCTGKEEKGERIVNILSVVTMVIHIALFIGFIYLRVSGKTNAVSPEELPFVLIISSTIALTASNVGKKGE